MRWMVEFTNGAKSYVVADDYAGAYAAGRESRPELSVYRVAGDVESDPSQNKRHVRSRARSRRARARGWERRNQ